MNLEQALHDKAHLSKALERAAVSSGLRETEQKLEMEVERRQSMERMLESMRGQVRVICVCVCVICVCVCDAGEHVRAGQGGAPRG
jgi:hypothetical protein